MRDKILLRVVEAFQDPAFCRTDGTLNKDGERIVRETARSVLFRQVPDLEAWLKAVKPLIELARGLLAKSRYESEIAEVQNQLEKGTWIRTGQTSNE